MYIQIFWSHTVALCEKPYWNWIIPEIISPISEQDQPVLWNDSYKKIDWLLNSSFWIQFTDSMLHFLS